MRAEPELEHEQAPDPLRSIEAAVVLVEQRLDGLWAKEPAGTSRRVEEDVPGERAQLASKPAPEWASTRGKVTSP